MLDRKNKEQIIKKFKIHKNDTGSPQVQIAILTEEVKRLTEHLKLHIHDYSSRRGLMKKVGERRRLLRYLEKIDEENFDELVKKLKIKISKKSQKKALENLFQEENPDANSDEKIIEEDKKNLEEDKKINNIDKSVK